MATGQNRRSLAAGLVSMAAVLLAPAFALAQTAQGFYVGAGAGLNFSSLPESSQGDTRISTNAGPVVLGSVGYRFGYGLRAELEGSYRNNDLNSIYTLRQNSEFLPLANVHGALSAPAVMANLLYDIPVALPVKPYIGAGIGHSWLDFGNGGGNGFGAFNLPLGNIVTGPDRVQFGSAGAFAYQVILGAALPIPAFPRLEATVEYRFFGAARANVPTLRTSTSNIVVNGSIPSVTSENGLAMHDNAILIGVRYNLW